MGNEQIGKMKLILQLLQYIDNLGLDGYIQGRYRLIADNKLRLRSQSPGYADSLPLSA